ncbi:MAG: hypothetical protein U0002_16800 [Thermoanaerobaculia bacterium]
MDKAPPVFGSQLTKACSDLRAEPLLVRVVALAPGAVALVGGALRDRLLGLPTKDLDLVVPGGAEALARQLARERGGRLVALGGDRFAAYRVVLPASEPYTVVDLWEHAGTTLEQDLERRDFTVNALALDLGSGRLTDLCGGLSDLEARRLRAVTPRSFAEDPLRVLRLARLAATLPGFAVEPGTLELARAAVSGLERVAAERVRTELELIFESPRAAVALRVLLELGIYPRAWLEDGEAPPQTLSLPALLESFEVEASALERNAPALAPSSRPAARWALSALAVGGGEAPLAHLAERGWLSKAGWRQVAPLLAAAELPRGEVARRRFLHRLGGAQDTGLALAATLARAGGEPSWCEAELPELVALALREGPELARPPKLLSGEEAAELLALAPGRELGRALAALRGAQVDGLVRDRAGALAFLAAWR